MFTKISLLKVSASASIFEHELAMQDFVKAANNISTSIASVAPVPTSASVVLSSRHVLFIPYVAAAEAFSSPLMHLLFELFLQEQEKVCIVAMPPSQGQLSRHASVRRKGKGKAKATEKNKDDNEDEVIKKMCQEIEDFVVPMTFADEELAVLLLPSSEYFEKDAGLPKGAKISGRRKAELVLAVPVTQVLVLQNNGACNRCIADNLAEHCSYLTGFKTKGKSKAIVTEKTGAKCAFKSKETIESNSNEEDKEERACVIKKIKCEHIKELIGKGKEKEVERMEAMVVSKAPMAMAGPLCPLPSKLTVVIFAGTSRPVAKVPITPSTVPVTSVARPTAPIKAPVPISVSASVLTASTSRQVVVPGAASALATVKPAVKVVPKVTDPFMVRHFKLAGTEESGVLIINQMTESDSGNNTGNDKEEDDDKDSKDKIEEEEGSAMVIDGDFLDLLCLKEVLQKSAMEVDKLV
ncbi:hypothetical protein C0995_001024 [Termitomyces sp. Mi166|nr:hypothetical protein C0995_001024 [Termitomyces sp. Mi166\